MPEPTYRKGDLVSFQWGLRRVEGVVKEDRGPIGIKGRHLYLVEFRIDPDSVFLIELPAAELQAVPHTVSRE